MSERYEDEDIDSILSSIQQGKAATLPPTVKAVPTSHVPIKPPVPVHDLSGSPMFQPTPKQRLPLMERVTKVKPSESSLINDKPEVNNHKKTKLSLFKRRHSTKKPIQNAQEVTREHVTQHTFQHPEIGQKAQTKSFNQVRRRSKLKKWVLLPPVVLILLVGTGFLASKSVMNFVIPASPFSKELGEFIPYPLLYPSKLPDGFEIDKTSVNKGPNDVVIYSIKNSNGNYINISLQPEPATLNIEALTGTLANIRTVKLPAGTTYIGTTEDDLITSYTLTGTVWIIARMPKDTISDNGMETMLGSLVEG